MGACRVQAILIGFPVLVPVFPFVNVRETELSILVRLVDAREEPLALLFPRKVKEYLEGSRSIAIEVALQVHHRAIALLPDVLLVTQLLRKSLVAQKLWMYPNNQHFLVIRTIEDADLPALGEAPRRTPEKIMF